MCYENWQFFSSFDILQIPQKLECCQGKSVNFHSTFKYERNIINNILTDQKNAQWVICRPKLLELLIFAPFRKVKMAQCHADTYFDNDEIIFSSPC